MPDTPESGLSDAEARARLAAEGPNELPRVQRVAGFALVRAVLIEPMFLLLLACGATYLAIGDRGEALMLLASVVVIIAITFVQRQRAERSLEALRDLSTPQARVVRDGELRRIDARTLVRGDRLVLSEGDRVPADARIVATKHLAVDESLLTGESAPVDKHGSPLTAQAGEVYAGTLVTAGGAHCVITATGRHSALGRIGESLASLKPEVTPLQQRTARVVRRVAAGGLVLAATLTLAHGLIGGDWLQGLLAGLTLAMAILPEEIPVVLSLFVAIGAWRLSRAGVLVRQLPTIELLGATTVLCVDKTGTLTANRMALRKLQSGDYSVDLGGTTNRLDEAWHALLEYAALASHRSRVDPMEAAILATADRLLAGTEHLHDDWAPVEDYPLSVDLLAMSRVWRSPEGSRLLVASKGAPEAVIDLCHLDDATRARVSAAAVQLAADGLRVLGVARATHAGEALPPDQHVFTFEFLGLLGFEDPVRPEVPAAIAECSAAGIRVVMLTGDHPATALAIAKAAGLDTSAGVVTGAELGGAATLQSAAGAAIFSRVQPEQKLALVQALRARGEIVAMTGDGINDGPALKAAHIGVAMGGRGTDVAREAADIVLVNDDFASLLAAVRHGRRIFTNLRKAIVFLIAAHLPIIGLSVAPLLFGWPWLLAPLHIVIFELIIDPACSLVFEAEPAEARAMQVPPRAPRQHLFDREVLVRGAWQGIGLLGLLLAVFVAARSLDQSDEVARTLTFTVMVLANLGLIHANRSWHGDRAAGSNRVLPWLAGATLAMLVLIIGVADVRVLFGFDLPPAPLLLAAIAVAASIVPWCTLVRRWTTGAATGRGAHAGA